MQGKNKNMLDIIEDINIFKSKMNLKIKRMEEGKIAAFPKLNLFIEETEINTDKLFPLFLNHIKLFLSEINRYIPNNDLAKNMPGLDDRLKKIEDDSLTEELIELQHRDLLKTKFNTLNVAEFWARLHTEEPSLRQLCLKAAEALLPFPTTYLCESAFSVLTLMKKDKRNRLNPEDDIRVALSSIEPDIVELVRKHQGQDAHQ